jgi:hypothetical protein
MSMRRTVTAGLVALGSLVLTGCSSTPSAQSTSTTTTSGPDQNRATTSSTMATTTLAPATAVNVAVSDQIRTQLVAAGAALNNIPAAQYTGLAPGLTYYAFDRATNTYWAGARLVPAPSADPSAPTQAQVSSQDEGSYYVFRQPAGGSWTVYPAGNTGPDSPCPVSIPSAVVHLWAWPAGSCRPPGA